MTLQITCIGWSSSHRGCRAVSSCCAPHNLPIWLCINTIKSHAFVGWRSRNPGIGDPLDPMTTQRPVEPSRTIKDPEAEQAKREALEAEERKRRQAGCCLLSMDVTGTMVFWRELSKMARLVKYWFGKPPNGHGFGRAKNRPSRPRWFLGVKTDICGFWSTLGSE